MRLFNFTVIKLTLCLILGIVLRYYLTIDPIVIVVLTSSLFLGQFILLFRLKNKFENNIWYGFLTYALFVLFGIVTVSIHDQKNFDNHYSNYIQQSDDSEYILHLRVREILKSNNFNEKYIVDILKINDQKTIGRSILNVEKYTGQHSLKVDDILIAKSSLNNIQSPLNPYQFDYKSYLSKRYIYHQIFLEKKGFVTLPFEYQTIFGFTNGIRRHINSKLKQFNFEGDELAIINALLLGQRQDISETVYNNYKNAGAVHILAVSGLHVGIVLLLLNFILKPLEQIKNGRTIKIVVVVALLWCFAIIAGLSASVTRAVTMFSILAVAINLKRPTNIYNTLAISVFILLLVKPMFLFDVGFQLSYVAVIAIVAIDPLLFKMCQPKNKIASFYWHTLTVTIAAQTGILPISLYYFHQFPALFFVSNLIIIPFLGIILGFGILIILLAILNVLPNFLASSFATVIELLNIIVGWVSSKKAFIFEDIPFDTVQLIATYFLIISFFIWFTKKDYSNLRRLLFSIVFLQLVFIYNKYSAENKEIIVFHKNKQTLLGHLSNSEVVVATQKDSLDYHTQSIIRDYKVGNRINKMSISNIKPLYAWNSKTLLIIDSLGIYNLSSLKPYYVLLSQSPKINLNRLIDSISPKLIIADGSNYKSYIQQWKATAEIRKIPFHDTNEKGAFILNK